MNLSKKSDEDLVNECRNERNEQYYELLRRCLKIYYLLINVISARFSYRLDSDDYILTFYKCFAKTINNYNIEKGKFKTYFSFILDRAIVREHIHEIDKYDHYIII